MTRQLVEIINKNGKSQKVWKNIKDDVTKPSLLDYAFSTVTATLNNGQKIQGELYYFGQYRGYGVGTYPSIYAFQESELKDLSSV